MAHDAIQAIKQLRRDVVEAMRALLKLAKDKQTSGMLPICEDMITKTRILLSLWDPGLVEEALTFLEEYKVAKVHDAATDDILNLDLKKTNQSLSPFKRITQQLNFDLKSPDFDDFVTPDTTPECVTDLWTKGSEKNGYSSLYSPKADHVQAHHATANDRRNVDEREGGNFVIFPEIEDTVKYAEVSNCTGSEAQANRKCGILEESDDHSDAGLPIENDAEIQVEVEVEAEVEAEGEAEVEAEAAADGTEAKEQEMKSEIDPSKRFLDTQNMCNSPSANYYKPTDEPEPWDLTQLNIEASVMCLVSKVKFLCGRCSSPAVRLRNKSTISRSHSLKGCGAGNRSRAAQVVTIQPKNDAKTDESSKLLESVESRSSFRQNSSPGSEKTMPAFSKAKEGKTESFPFLSFLHLLALSIPEKSFGCRAKWKN